MLRPGDRVGVAVSGGADSVALLCLLLELRGELGLVVSAVHFNHGLRGAEADADEQFVAELAHEHGIDLFAERGDTADLAAKQGKGIEAAARDLRYAFFRRLLAEAKLNRIATAHTLDDQAETVLMRMLRGTGVHGLRGILPCLAGAMPGAMTAPRADEAADTTRAAATTIVRPLLAVRRVEVEAYLHRIGQPWREDSSNCDVQLTRNRVRHELLPLLEEKFNPEVKQRLAELAEIAGLSLTDTLNYGAKLNAEVRATPDLHEGVAAFLEKRSPDWPSRKQEKN